MVQVLLKSLRTQTNKKVLHDSGSHALLVAASFGHVEVVALLSLLEIIASRIFHAMLTSVKKQGKARDNLPLLTS